ncbi:hypothetical protein ACWEIJ_20230 [Lentzea sp. NPDC004789]
MPALAAAAISDVRIGSRVVPRGGLPSIGAVPGIPGYLHAVAHSGVILAPVIGARLAALAVEIPCGGGGSGRRSIAVGATHRFSSSPATSRG